jgi:hypothetical protein
MPSLALRPSFKGHLGSAAGAGARPAEVFLAGTGDLSGLAECLGVPGNAIRNCQAAPVHGIGQFGDYRRYAIIKL